MNAFAIKRIPNPEHTRLVLDTRQALRIVPPSEGVWFASVAGARQGQDAQRLEAEPARAARSEAEGDAQTGDRP